MCIRDSPDDAKRAKIRLTGTAADKEVLQRVVKDEISQLLDPLAMKVPRADANGLLSCPGRRGLVGRRRARACLPPSHFSACHPPRLFAGGQKP
eukprot:3301948-Prymnesium_polylepis.2